jgi:hypothetical protein
VPKLLDLYCCAGGAAVGYHRAGWDVTGVDINNQPNYPFTFHQADALEFLLEHGHEYDAVHASPPCQGYTALAAVHKNLHPMLIPATRKLLNDIALPYVIENVLGSPLRRDVLLCGEMFGLAVIRHRIFELGNWSMQQPNHPAHRGRVAGMRHGEWFQGPYFAVYGKGGGKGTVAQWQVAMGIDWTNVRKEIAEAIPPAYTELIGKNLIKHIEGK